LEDVPILKDDISRKPITINGDNNGNLSREILVCPYLGTEEDPQTSFLFTSQGNYCHRLSPARPVSTGYQGRICFDRGAFVACPLYEGERNNRLPEGFVQNRDALGKPSKLVPRWILFTLTIALASLAITIYLLSTY
jgi:hypothetical protein